jgi:hypothetical protein
LALFKKKKKKKKTTTTTTTTMRVYDKKGKQFKWLRYERLSLAL